LRTEKRRGTPAGIAESDGAKTMTETYEQSPFGLNRMADFIFPYTTAGAGGVSDFIGSIW
jgi:hypothetical protein